MIKNSLIRQYAINATTHNKASINFFGIVSSLIVFFASYILTLVHQSLAMIPFFALYGVINFGLIHISLKVIRGKPNSMSDGFYGFNIYLKVFCTYFLISIISFLWGLLLIIPGIIKSYAYALSPYLIDDNKDLKPMEALKKSESMMQGHKMQLFLLDLYYVLLFFVAILFTFGIGLIWLYPQYMAARAIFYNELKGDVDDDNRWQNLNENDQFTNYSSHDDFNDPFINRTPRRDYDDFDDIDDIPIRDSSDRIKNLNDIPSRRKDPFNDNDNSPFDDFDDIF